MMAATVATVVGARPQFIKAAVVSRAIATTAKGGIDEILIHTGQHYDPDMSQVFFDELEIPYPDENLGIMGGSHGASTGAMLGMLERVFVQRSPAAVIVYGDTNSTLAGALAASKLGIPVVHVEAGLRSFNRSMPEEINRVLVDHISSLLLAPTASAARQLLDEGIREGVSVVGDTMLDAVQQYAPRASSTPRSGPYAVLTIHRAETATSRTRLAAILEGLSSSPIPFVFPVHPRTKEAIVRFGLEVPQAVEPISPVSYLQMIGLVRDSAFVATDSGGLQKEAFYLRRPCLTLRDETEWTELVELDVNRVVGAVPQEISEGIYWALRCDVPSVNPYGDGHAGQAVVKEILRLLR